MMSAITGRMNEKTCFTGNTPKKYCYQFDYIITLQIMPVLFHRLRAKLGSDELCLLPEVGIEFAILKGAVAAAFGRKFHTEAG